MEVKRFWILMPVIPLVPLLVVLWLLTQTRGAVWNIVLMFVLLAAFYICILVRNAKLCCPACGAGAGWDCAALPAPAERDIYCPNCGQHIEIVK